ncbi:hypothetical protein H2508_03830 [Parahaliea sp. F7430]|uniref:Pentapeptide MXKDX repeat protein n=1 Tax=Sediminihaliea albiluteola TaxID=2758564 RepID=A0A7W2YJF0_9GAMM|nr:hypothetical protein [Sediminihaliea albiluteola]MBA6412233.1 hypothetical protein [Sediminihaliea albiluteola]
MKIKTLTFAIALSTLAFTVSAQAHDPKEHMKNAEKPDCSAMKNMDHSKMDHNKMDMDDPVMQAMMKQCMKNMHHDENSADESHDDHQKDRNDHDPKHQH